MFFLDLHFTVQKLFRMWVYLLNGCNEVMCLIVFVMCNYFNDMCAHKGSYWHRTNPKTKLLKGKIKYVITYYIVW